MGLGAGKDFEQISTFFVFALEFLDEVVDEAVIKIFSTKMIVTAMSLNL